MDETQNKGRNEGKYGGVSEFASQARRVFMVVGHFGMIGRVVGRVVKFS
jgi:hypothetical protein